LGTLKWDFENDFENLGVVLYSTKMFQKWVLYQIGDGMEKKELVVS
jgi:hypothetical protein